MGKGETSNKCDGASNPQYNTSEWRLRQGLHIGDGKTVRHCDAEATGRILCTSGIDPRKRINLRRPVFRHVAGKPALVLRMSRRRLRYGFLHSVADEKVFARDASEFAPDSLILPARLHCE